MNSIDEHSSLSEEDVEEWPALDSGRTSPAEQSKYFVETTPSKGISHCASSPDFRRFIRSSEDDDTSVASSVVSFRDAMLSTSAPRQVKEDEELRPSTTPRRQRIQPRFVIKPTIIRRCSKSTGDLLAMAKIQENDDDDEFFDDDVLYDCHYNNKAHGARGRMNGRKLRPDEAKRKEMIIHKKNIQRAGRG